ncbi:MAG: PadR family transcriptional regulator [bacterium]|nr:PadR family transcriptional regulator [bacterium]
MNILTRVEEFILLAIWNLQENAYSLAIQKQISETSKEKWSLGTIYAPLERLEKRGLITSYLSDSIPERGGRQRRIYQITGKGKEVLIKTREVERSMWATIPGLTGDVKS